MHEMESCSGDVDIEDLSMPAEAQRIGNENVVTRVVRRKSNQQKGQPVGESHIPGTQSVYIRTWGCAHNNSDSEYMAGILSSYGYRISPSGADADLWLLNSCTVKNPAEDHFRNAVNEASSAGKAIVVAGCVPQGSPNTGYLRDVSVVGVQQIDRVVEVVEETLKGNTVRLMGTRRTETGARAGGASLELPKIRRNPLIEILAINTGCLNACTYCKTKHARGVLGSYPPNEIVARAVQAFSEGVVELWLTSEDLGAYGRDLGTNLPALLRELVKVIPEDCMMRLGMTNPPYILKHLTEMAEILNHPRVYAFLHIPVQSGSDNVLGEMRREYTCEEFSRVVDTLRALVPGLTVATDIICGFPTETEEDFEETMALVEKYRFPSLFINQFFPRPGTPAARMVRLATPAEVKQRTKRMTNLFHSYRTYDEKLGTCQHVLVTEESHDKNYYVGHNKFYEQVLVPKEDGLMGRTADVKITECGKHFMKAEILHSTPVASRVVQRNDEAGVPLQLSRLLLGVTVGLLLGRVLHKAWRLFAKR